MYSFGNTSGQATFTSLMGVDSLNAMFLSPGNVTVGVAKSENVNSPMGSYWMILLGTTADLATMAAEVDGGADPREVALAWLGDWHARALSPVRLGADGRAAAVAGPFDEAHIEFSEVSDPSPGVTLLTGRNGTGKTIVLDAIRGLFGPLFATVIVNVTLLPTFGVGLLAVLVRLRSAMPCCVEMLTWSSSPLPLPLPGTESGSN